MLGLADGFDAPRPIQDRLRLVGDPAGRGGVVSTLPYPWQAFQLMAMLVALVYNPDQYKKASFSW